MNLYLKSFLFNDWVNCIDCAKSLYERFIIEIKNTVSHKKIKNFLTSYIKDFENDNLDSYDNKNVYPYKMQIHMMSELLSKFNNYKKKTIFITSDDIRDKLIRLIETFLSLESKGLIQIESISQYTPLSLKIIILQPFKSNAEKKIKEKEKIVKAIAETVSTLRETAKTTEKILEISEETKPIKKQENLNKCLSRQKDRTSAFRGLIKVDIGRRIVEYDGKEYTFPRNGNKRFALIYELISSKGNKISREYAIKKN